MRITTIGMLLLVATTSKAQKVWTLDDCIDYALQHSAAVQKSRVAADNARQDRGAAAGGFIPTISGSVSGQFAWGRNVDPETNTYNTKFAYVFAAKDKSAARSFQEMFDRISAGEPAVAVGDKLFDEMNKPLWQPFAQNVSSTYIAPEILTTLKRCEANFDTEIGIPNANTDKRERLISDEVNANNVETYSKASLWMDFIKLGFDEVNAKFGLNLRVEWRIQPDIERSADNATADINTDNAELES